MADQPHPQLSATQQPRASHSILALAAAIFVLAGCGSPANIVQTDSPRTTAPYTEAPVSKNFPTSAQLKLQAAQHWTNIADDTGKAVAAMLRKGSLCLPAKKRCDSVYVNPPAVVTEFSRTFHNQLITTMVTNGLSVAREPAAAVLIDIDVQPVFFATNRPQYRHAGQAVEMGPGIWALRDVISTDPADPTKSPPDADLPHWYRTEFASGATPPMEIVVTVSAADDTRYLARATNIYYVTEGDRHLYDHEICSMYRPCPKPVPPAPPEPPAGKRPRPIGVTGDCPIDKPCVEPEEKPKPRKKKA